MSNDHNFDIIFRGPVQEDMAILEKWYGMTDSFGYATGLKDFSEMVQIIESPKDTSSLLFMIHKPRNDSPIGFLYAHTRNTVLWIRILIIDPAFQKKGFGTLAINKLINYAKMKYQSLICIAAVSSKNSKGISFWEKAGFFRSSELEQVLQHVGEPTIYIFKKVI